MVRRNALDLEKKPRKTGIKGAVSVSPQGLHDGRAAIVKKLFTKANSRGKSKHAQPFQP